MEPADCGRCNETTSEYLELGETAYCGMCIHDVLEPLRCCLCEGRTDVWIDSPIHKHPNVYCRLCLDELEKSRIAEIHRDDTRNSLPLEFATTVPEEETGTPENKKQKK